MNKLLARIKRSVVKHQLPLAWGLFVLALLAYTTGVLLTDGALNKKISALGLVVMVTLLFAIHLMNTRKNSEKTERLSQAVKGAEDRITDLNETTSEMKGTVAETNRAIGSLASSVDAGNKQIRQAITDLVEVSKQTLATQEQMLNKQDEIQESNEKLIEATNDVFQSMERVGGIMDEQIDVLGEISDNQKREQFMRLKKEETLALGELNRALSHYQDRSERKFLRSRSRRERELTAANRRINIQKRNLQTIQDQLNLLS